MNAAAIRPRVSTWRAPSAPSRVKTACASRNASASWTAASWACWILLATSGGAIAHNVETDFAGLNVRSKPATDPFPNLRPSAVPVTG